MQGTYHYQVIFDPVHWGFIHLTNFVMFYIDSLEHTNQNIDQVHSPKKDQVDNRKVKS